jgi:hypothetical protein
MSETSRERVARNQAVYRQVNEAIRAGRDESQKGPQPFVCECAILGCNELVELTVEQYEAVRQSPQRFVILKGHDIPEAESVIWDDGGDVVVVEKDSDLAPITRALDPRS